MSRYLALIPVRSRAVRGVTIALSLLANSILLMGKGPARSAIAPNPAPLPTAASSKAHSRLIESYGRLPMSFEINQGQADPQVKFLSRGSGYTLFLTGNEATLALRAPRPMTDRGRWPTILAGFDRQFPHMAPKGHNPEPAAASVVHLKLVGVNHAVKVDGLDELPGKSNYFIGDDPKKWRTNVPTFTKVKYEDVYPGVDLVYYGKQGQLEYDFVVRPGADPKAITLAFDGDIADRTGPRPTAVRIDSNGDLVVPTKDGEVLFHKPVVYQPARSGKKFLDGKYVLNGERAVAFEVATYDSKKPLVIDPVLSYVTYLGGDSIWGPDIGHAIAVDTAGNAYVAGQTGSTNFPVTSAAAFPDPVYGGGAFVAKLNADGSALLYSTYLGAYQATGIAVDNAGNAYVTGGAQGGGLPTTPGAFQTSHSGDYGAFVTKLNPTGSALVYSTFVAGTSNWGEAITVDALGSAYVTGYTTSCDLPVTPGAFQTICKRADYHGFVSKLNATGSALVYSTYLGGTVFDRGLGIAIDADGNAYIAGDTESLDFPTTTGAFQPTAPPNTGPIVIYGFVSKLNAAGSALIYSTYLGGSLGDEAQDVAVDSSGNAYVTGLTNSRDFPTTPGTFKPTKPSSCGTCAFVTKLNATGSALLYSTYLGAADGRGIRVDAAGDAYVTRTVAGAGFPTTPGAFQNNFGGGEDAYLSKLNATGSALVYSTYLGGTRNENAFSVAIDAFGNAYITGLTESPDLPTTPNAFQQRNGGQTDVFVAKIPTLATAGPPVADAGQDQTHECTSPGGTAVILNGAGSYDPKGNTLSYQWTDSSGRTVGTTAAFELALPVGQHTFTLTVSDGQGGIAADQVVVTVRDTKPPTISAILSQSTLSPPDHRQVPITATIQAADVCDPSLRVVLTSITSSEPDSGLGLGDLPDDIQGATYGTDDRSFLLRAESFGPTTGRIYTVTYRATDSSGNSASSAPQVFVPLARPAPNAPRFAYVPNFSDNTVSLYTVDAATGRLLLSGTIATGQGPSAVTIGGFLYVPNYYSNNVSAFAINTATGGLTAITGSPFPAGTSPVSARVSADGHFLYVANVGSNNVSAYKINATTGALSAVAGSPFAAGSAPYYVATDPSRRYLYVANSVSNNISAYTINLTTGALMPIAGSPFPTGRSPRSERVDATGRFLYVTNYGSNNVSAYTINITTGALTQVAGSPFAAGTAPVSVNTDPTGQFAYVANSGSNNVSAYTINSMTGALAPVNGAPFAAGMRPRYVQLESSGHFVYVVNAGSNSISIFTIEAGTGALTPLAVGLVVTGRAPDGLTFLP